MDPKMTGNNFCEWLFFSMLLRHSTQPGRLARFGFIARLVLAVQVSLAADAAIPSPEKLLPDDTLAMITVPDVSKLREITKKLPLNQLWDDPSMKPFREHLVTKWNEDFVKPLERDLGIKLADYTALLQGQLTLALTQGGLQTEPDQQPGFLLLLDSKDKSGQMKKNLTDLRKKWVDAGKTLRTEKIREIEFTVLPISTNDTPKTLRKFFPPSSKVQELGDDKEVKPEPKSELVLGQYESLLVIGSSTKAVERVAIRLTGGSSPALGESAAYQANHLLLFRDSPLFGWVNMKAVMDALTRAAAAKKENPDAPNPFDFKPEKIIAALGFSGLKTAGFAFQGPNEGSSFQLFLGIPEAGRQGIFKILAGEAKETSPPLFVPADAVKFQRWRIDGQKAWATLQKMVSDMSPQWLNGINFLLETANTAAKDKDPGFDIRKNLIGNLGDDMISYEKAAKAGATPDAQTPSIFLLGSSNAEQLAGALKSVLVYVSQQAGTPPEEREFLGRKIYSVPMRAMAFPGTAPAKATPSTLHYAASAGYVAFSTDASMVEEFLRSSDTQPKSLRETSGLVEAAQKVSGPGASLFGYENQVETTRAFLELLRRDTGAETNSNAVAAANLLPNALGVTGPGQNLKGWFDFSLLPPFDKISKYFYLMVYGGRTTVDGLAYKVYLPSPPGLRSVEASKR